MKPKYVVLASDESEVLGFFPGVGSKPGYLLDCKRHKSFAWRKRGVDIECTNWHTLDKSSVWTKIVWADFKGILTDDKSPEWDLVKCQALLKANL